MHRARPGRPVSFLAGFLLVLVLLGNAAHSATAITILQPNGGTFVEGDTMTISWVYPQHGCCVVFYLSVDAGISFRYALFQNKVTMTSDSGVVRWPIPIDPSLVATGALIQVYDYDVYINQGISKPFAIAAKSASIRQAVSPKSVSAVNATGEIYSLQGVALKGAVSGRLPFGVFAARSPSGAARLAHGTVTP